LPNRCAWQTTERFPSRGQHRFRHGSSRPAQPSACQLFLRRVESDFRRCLNHEPKGLMVALFCSSIVGSRGGEISEFAFVPSRYFPQQHLMIMLTRTLCRTILNLGAALRYEPDEGVFGDYQRCCDPLRQSPPASARAVSLPMLLGSGRTWDDSAIAACIRPQSRLVPDIIHSQFSDRVEGSMSFLWMTPALRLV